MVDWLIVKADNPCLFRFRDFRDRNFFGTQTCDWNRGKGWIDREIKKAEYKWEESGIQTNTKSISLCIWMTSFNFKIHRMIISLQISMIIVKTLHFIMLETK